MINLTPVQYDEISGLLDVCADEAEEWGEPWGVLAGHALTITRPAEAVDDIERRADYLRAEGAESGEARKGAAMARTLNALADRITKGER